MFNIPAITWTLTAILLFSGGYHCLQATRSHRLTDRVNNILHALMTVVMAAMLWNLVPSTMLAQIALLTGAALWFVIQAVARPEFKAFCAGSQGRIKCLYHGLTMAGGAVMVAMMGLATTHHAPAAAMPMPNAHHAMSAATPSTPVAAIDHSPDVAIALTGLFGAAAVVFVVLLLRYRVAGISHRHAAASRLSVRTEHGLEALGAAVMALMFATMSA